MKITIGMLVENEFNETGRVISLRKDSALLNILKTGEIKSSLFKDLSHMNTETKDTLKSLSEAHSIDLVQLEKVYYKSIASWDKTKAPLFPKQYAMEQVQEYIKNDFNRLFEAKVLKKEDQDYNAALAGISIPPGMAGSGSASLPTNEDIPKDIKEWISNPKTIAQFKSRYPNNYQSKLDEAAQRMANNLNKRNFKHTKSKLQHSKEGYETDAPPPTGFAKQC